MPRHLISDAHEWINEIPTVPIYWECYDFLKAIVSWALDTPSGILWAPDQGSACRRPSAIIFCSAECCVWDYPGQTYFDQ